ncbi:hypothetical protein GE09DRAFT_305693 [Coniochaeta sp. 2T2.1]|nr:hypothetical protein GE09DRAFT_305693 [Coniochaeta sp. 2T2.1]
MSRYTGRYEGPDRRSRSPRDRSPFDRGQYNDGDRRRSTVDNRPQFQNNRDGFRDPPPGREPPRGPKALLDRPLEPPVGPRGGGYLGRGGRGRGRGYRRDDSRDRGRDRDFDPRERPPYRDERSRERERDWRDRDRDTRPVIDSFRGRRSPPPVGRGRSPLGRDFRDTRDPPLGVDVERARRGSRDGPLSAGSSNSDPPFSIAPSGYRGVFRGGDRGRGRGRGDYDRGRGGGRGGFYDDRDRFGPRSRSNDRGGWGRERDDRDRIDRYPPDQDRMLHREPRNERELLPERARDVAMRSEQATREPSVATAKDMSPPPIAPSAPAFGSIPSRQPSNADLQSLTGKAPPTGPRALTEERQVPHLASTGHANVNERLPPTGPSQKLSMPPGSPPIPTAPRAQIVAQQQKHQRSSKHWINPAIAPKKAPDSPKSQRSQSFVSQQGRPPLAFRPQFSHSDQHPDFERRPHEPSYPDRREPERQRPRSSDGQPASVVTDAHRRSIVISGPNAVPLKTDRTVHSARTSMDRDTKPPIITDEGTRPTGEPYVAREGTKHGADASASRAAEFPGAVRRAPEPKQGAEVLRPKKSRMRVPCVRITFVPKKVALTPGQSDSEDEETGVFLDQEIKKEQEAIAKLTRPEGGTEVPLRQALLMTEAGKEVAVMVEGINDALRPSRPVPGSAVAASDKVREWLTKPAAGGSSAPDSRLTDAGPLGDGQAASKPSAGDEADMDEPMLSPSDKHQGAPITPGASSKASVPDTSVDQAPSGISNLDETVQTTTATEPQPKVEEVDTGLPPAITAPALPAANAVDTDMPDAAEAADPVAPLPTSLPAINGMSHIQGSMLSPYQEGEDQVSRETTPGKADDDDETEIEEIDFATLETVRRYMATPPLDDLPHFDVRPWYESNKVRKAYEAPAGLADFIIRQLADEFTVNFAEQTEKRRDYRDRYESYLRFTLSDDPIAVKSRDHFNECNAPDGRKPATAPESKPEGGRRGRFATDLDVQYAIQQSIREEKERLEREERAQKEKFRSEKEAVIPDMFWTQEEREREVYLDHTGFLPVEKLVSAWQVLPPVVNFTEDEAARFEKTYLEFPKQWGKIASEVPNRNFAACIEYYYTKKKELNLKEKLKKQPKRRKKSKKQRSSALVSELGNPENEGEENQETGENGERRRPRRAAAPTWGYENTPAADSDGTSAATPARRGAGSKNDSGAEKTEATKKQRRTRQPKDKDAKAAKPAQQALAPTPAPAAKANRSRSNSRAQAPPEWAQTPTPLGEIGRIPMKFDNLPPLGMQPQMPHIAQASLASPERIQPPAPSSLSEVMAPPSLRPEPPPPPPSHVATFEIGHGPDRIRTPQQASSYWSVSETTDFPGLLRAFGTDWSAIATHMQTKTAVMVKNYYVRSKDSKPEWEQFATEADNKKARGENRPAPPTISTGPRKRYDTPMPGIPPGSQRILAAAEPLSLEDLPQSKMESPGPGPGAPLPQGQPFAKRFQVPIAQAPASQPPLAQPVAQQQQMQTQATSAHTVTQAMSPGNRPLRAPIASFAYPERDEPLVAQQPAQQAVRHSQKASTPVSVSSPGTGPVPQPPVTEAMSSRATWPADLGPPLRQQQPQYLQAREPRERVPRLESQLREGPPPRHADRGPARLKQESDSSSHYESPFANPQPSQRVVQSRPEQPTAVRQQQPEPPRAVAPPTQPFAPVAQTQPVRTLLGESVPPQQQATPDRLMSGMSRPMATSMQDPYAAASGSGVQTPVAPAPPPPSRPTEPKKSSLFSLLNDDPAPAPPPKRVTDVSSAMKSSSTPPPQGMGVRPPPTSSTSLRREPEPTPYGYRSQVPPSSVMPSLKPYSTQSPQPHHSSVPRPMVSTTDSPVSAGERGGYFSRHEYGQPHQVQAANSPQGHPYLRDPQHAQPSPMAYQPQSSYPPYGSSVSQQPHSASPTPPFSAHQPPRERREAQHARDGSWQQSQGLPPQQQPASAMQHQQQGGWPGSQQQQPPKPREQSSHAASPWGAQHGAPIKPQVSTPLSSQPSWAQAQQSQTQHHLSGLRDDRGPVYGGMHERGPPAGMVQHGHHRSLTGQFPPQDLRRPEPPRPGPGQPSYVSYPSAAERQQPRDARDLRDPRDPGPGRPYTPTPMYDTRPPPSGDRGQPYTNPTMQEQMREMQYREMAARDAAEREAVEREAARQHAAARQQQAPPGSSGLQQRLRPQESAYDRHPERFH